MVAKASQKARRLTPEGDRFPAKWDQEEVGDSRFDILILWWPLDKARAAPSDLVIPVIRFRCVGQSFGKRFRLDAAESHDPLPEGLTVQQKGSIAKAVVKAAASKLGVPVMELAWHRCGDISEWYRGRNEGAEVVLV